MWSGRGDDLNVVLNVLPGVRRVPVKIQVIRNIPVRPRKPLVEIDEGETQTLGQFLARSGLARPTGTDETNHRRIFSMGRPLASSSTSLSMYRIFRISGSSISWIRTPQMVPVILLALGWN